MTKLCIALNQMLNYFVQLMLFFVPGLLFGQTLVPYLSHGLYGFADSASGQLVVPCQFDTVLPFNSYGFAVVRKGMDWRIWRDGELDAHVYLKGKPDFFPFLGENTKNVNPNLLRIQVADREPWTTPGEGICISCPFGVYNLSDGYFSGIIYMPNYVKADETFWQFSGIGPDYYHQRENRFRKGLLPVRKIKGQTNFIDHTGREVLPGDFLDVNVLDEQFFVAIDSTNRCALATASGKLLTPYLYTNITKIGDGPYFCVNNGLFNTRGTLGERIDASSLRRRNLGLLNQHGTLILDTIYESILPWTDSLFVAKSSLLFSVVDHTGYAHLAMAYDFLTPVNKHLIAFREFHKTGLLNRQLKMVQPAIFSNLNLNQRDQYGTFTKNGVMGIIDSTGNIVLETRSTNLKMYSTRSIVFSSDRGWGLMNLDGKEIFPASFQEIKYFRGDSIFQIIVNGLAGLVSIDGTTLIPPTYLEIRDNHQEIGFIYARKADGFDVFDGRFVPITPSSNDLASTNLPLVRPCWTNGKHLEGLCDKWGRELVSPIYQDMRCVYTTQDSAWICKGSLEHEIQLFNSKGVSIVPSGWQINRKGQQVAPDYSMAVIKKEGLEAIIHHTGSWVIPPQQSACLVLTNRLAAVNQSGKWQLVDPKGKPLSSTKYDHIGDVHSSQHISVGNYMSEADNNYPSRHMWMTWINANAKPLTALKYNWISGFNAQGLATAFIGWTPGQTQSIIVDTTGREVLKTEFDGLNLCDKYIIAQKNNKVGVINHSGKTIIPIAYDYVHCTAHPEVFILSNKDGQQWTINAAGKVLANKPLQPFWVTGMPAERSLFNDESGQILLLNQNGAVLETFDQNHLYFSPKHPGYAIVKEHGKAVWVDLKTGKWFKDKP